MKDPESVHLARLYGVMNRVCARTGWLRLSLKWNGAKAVSMGDRLRYPFNLKSGQPA
ncbi:hypothetical protein [Treponema phagedenis]|uniref:hypothetical protein n=1 Tax=Treponema phagedenis TaxID=162 RepID=UPI0021CCDE76|nr:hypothetical protein [Treponema phagedenis]